MWHQPWSTSAVSTAIPTSRPAGEWRLTVSTAVGSPAAVDAARAALVAAVAPSCETPMTSPRSGGASDTSNACSVPISAPRSPAAVAASRRISTVAWAACSDVPQPVTTTGSPADSVARIASASSAAPPPGADTRSRIRCASAGSAAIMSVM